MSGSRNPTFAIPAFAVKSQDVEMTSAIFKRRLPVILSLRVQMNLLSTLLE
jgi:hypothetical protein